MKKVLWMLWLFITVNADAQNTRIQRLAILRSDSQMVVSNRSIVASRFFNSICADYDRDEPTNTTYSYTVANGAEVPVTIRYADNTTRSSNLASAITRGLIQFRTIEEDSYDRLYPVIRGSNVRSITISSIRTPVVVSPYHNDMEDMNFNIIYRNFPDIFLTSDLQTEYWRISFLINVLRDNHQLQMSADGMLTSDALLTMKKIRESPIFKKTTRYLEMKEIRPFIVLNDDGSISRNSLNNLLSEILKTTLNWRRVARYWNINTIKKNDSSLAVKLREILPNNAGTVGTINGGKPPEAFNNEYEYFKNFLNSEGCMAKVCLETQPGDTLNFKITFEFSCTNPADRSSESASFSIEYNTADGFNISGNIEKSKETGVAGIELVLSPKNLHPESCKLEITGRFCFPDGPEIELDYCGARHTGKLKSLKFMF